MRRQLQVPLDRGRLRIGQQRIAQGHRDEGAELSQRRGFGAAKQLAAVSVGGSRHVPCPQPPQHVGDIAVHVEADPVRPGCQPPPEQGPQLRHLCLQRALAHRPVTVEPGVQFAQAEPVRIQGQQRQDLKLPPGEPQGHAVKLRAGLAEQLEFQQSAAGTRAVPRGGHDGLAHFASQ